jgi:hypothetical protein
MHRSLVVGGLVCSCLALAQIDDVPTARYPRLPNTASSPQGFIPTGWKLERRINTDLNADGRADVVLVLHQNDPANVIRNPNGFGAQVLNSNPRLLAVIFAQRDGYRLVTQNNALIPRWDSPTMDDPFADLSSQNRVFKVKIGFWASAGTWFTSTSSFVFRWQNGCVRLIGFDGLELQRNSGEFTETSVNYLTARVKTITGYEGKETRQTTWSTLKQNRLVCLDRLGSGFAFNPKLESN